MLEILVLEVVEEHIHAKTIKEPLATTRVTVTARHAKTTRTTFPTTVQALLPSWLATAQPPNQRCLHLLALQIHLALQ